MMKYSSKVIDDTVDEQLAENAPLRVILQWYERHIYRHLYLPLFQPEIDTTIKCVRIDISRLEEKRSLFEFFSPIPMLYCPQLNFCIIWIRLKAMFIFPKLRIYSL